MSIALHSEQLDFIHERIVEGLTKQGFRLTPPIYGKDFDRHAHPGDGVEGRTRYFLGDWRVGSMGRPGWPISATVAEVFVPRPGSDAVVVIRCYNNRGTIVGDLRVTGKMVHMAAKAAVAMHQELHFSECALMDTDLDGNYTGDLMCTCYDDSLDWD